MKPKRPPVFLVSFVFILCFGPSLSFIERLSLDSWHKKLTRSSSLRRVSNHFNAEDGFIYPVRSIYEYTTKLRII